MDEFLSSVDNTWEKPTQAVKMQQDSSVAHS
jgi:hypothetical protein